MSTHQKLNVTHQKWTPMHVNISKQGPTHQKTTPAYANVSKTDPNTSQNHTNTSQHIKSRTPTHLKQIPHTPKNTPNTSKKKHRPLKKVLFDTTRFLGAQNLTQEQCDSWLNFYDNKSKEQCFEAICEHITAV